MIASLPRSPRPRVPCLEIDLIEIRCKNRLLIGALSPGLARRRRKTDNHRLVRTNSEQAGNAFDEILYLCHQSLSGRVRVGR